MNKLEFELVLKIFELKDLKSKHIFYQRYADAADARDQEREFEWQLLNLLGHKRTTSVVTKEKLLNEYFLKRFSIEYPKNMTIEFKKKLIRQIKLEELGI